jgi:hypothetical protein
MNAQSTMGGGKAGGFVLMEVLVAMVVTVLIITGALGVFLACHRIWQQTSLEIRASHAASMTLEHIVYGTGTNCGLRSARSSSVSISTNSDGWALVYEAPDEWRNPTSNRYAYIRSSNIIYYLGLTPTGFPVVVGHNVATSAVSTNVSGLTITVRVDLVRGRFAATNGMHSFVRFRN